MKVASDRPVSRWFNKKPGLMAGLGYGRIYFAAGIMGTGTIMGTVGMAGIAGMP